MLINIFLTRPYISDFDNKQYNNICSENNLGKDRNNKINNFEGKVFSCTVEQTAYLYLENEGEYQQVKNKRKMKLIYCKSL